MKVLGIGKTVDMVWDNILTQGEEYFYITATALLMLIGKEKKLEAQVIVVSVRIRFL